MGTSTNTYVLVQYKAYSTYGISLSQSRKKVDVHSSHNVYFAATLVTSYAGDVHNGGPIIKNSHEEILSETVASNFKKVCFQIYNQPR